MNLFRRHQNNDIVASRLYDQNSFYKAFLADIKNCQNELVIESPFITTSRINILLPHLRKLSQRGVKILVDTRDPIEHDEPYRWQAQQAVDNLQDLGITVLYTAGHHRKLAIIDRETVWEGSLNILSHYDSCEIMRVIRSTILAEEMMQFLNIEPFLSRTGIYNDRLH